MRAPLHTTICLVALLASLSPRASRAGDAPPDTRLSTWQRGLSVDSVAEPGMRVYLWFYEWQLFDAVEKGQMTRGAFTGLNIDPRKPELGVHELPTSVSADRLSGSVAAPERGLKLEMKAVPEGAELTLTVTNRSDHDWPELAAVIPCFNPGPEAARNKHFANTNTYFQGPHGLQPLAIKTPREMHFNRKLRPAVDAEADSSGKYVWADKWPKSDVDAVEGLIIRESTGLRWVAGIAWERFVTVQGHNPWECMHLSVNVGPLKQGETRSIRGKIYLFKGNKEGLLSRYCKDFGCG